MSTISKNKTRVRDLTKGSLLGTLMRLAAPVAVAMVLQSLYQMVDMYWLGRMSPDDPAVSERALAALGASGPLSFVVWALAMGFSTAGTALVSQHTGAGNHREASRAAGQTIVFLFAISIPVISAIIVFAPGLFDLFAVKKDVLPMASVYMRIAMVGMPFLILHIGYGSALRALGDTMTPLIIVAASNLFNVVLDPLLIHGYGIFPTMGIAGAALATALSQVVAAGLSVECMRRQVSGLQLSLSDLRPHGHTLRQIASIGAPAAINMSSGSVGFVFFQWMINLMGSSVMAAFTLSFRVLHLFGIPGPAMATAAAPVVGQALGGGKPELARRAVGMSAMIVAVVLLPPIIGITIWGGAFARIFTDKPEVIAESARFFKVVPISLYFFMVIIVLTAAFNGSGHTRPPMMVTFLRWTIRLSVAFLLAFPYGEHHHWLGRMGAGMGSMGIYLSMVVANSICAVVLLAVFLKGNWQQAVIRPAGLQIRPYRPEDRPAVLHAHRQVLADTGLDTASDAWDAELDSIQATCSSPDGEFLVGELHDDIVAVGTVRRAGPGRAEVPCMLVLPAFQRRGFGRAMLTALEERAVEMGCSTLKLDAPALLEPAVRLYRTAGYDETGREPWQGTETVSFERQLPSPEQPS